MKRELFILLVSAFLLSSCLEVDSTIELKKNGTGTWSLKYRFAQEASFITPGPELSGFDYFPQNEEELRKRIRNVSGPELLQMSVETNAGFTEYSAEICFLNTDDIELFFNNAAINSLVEISSEEDGRFTLTIQKPYTQDIDQDTSRLLSALYPEYTVKITASLPGIVTSSSTGILSEDPEKASFEIRTVEIITMPEKIEWLITYE